MEIAVKWRVSMRWSSYILRCTVAALASCLLPVAFGAVILVTNDYPTIQAAIDAAGTNDTVQVQTGTYREFLNITAPIRIIGSGSTNCIVHHTNDVLVTITSAGTVELTGLEICGGEVAFGGGFSPTVPRGIVASNTTLVLNEVAVNMTRNFAVTVLDGSLYATNVALYTRNVLVPWDVGFQLKGCFARFYQLTQQAGQIDHTININDPPANFSDVRVENSTIRASRLGYGECIRTYSQSSVVITNCDLYRAPGGDPVSIGNQAIGVNGFSNIVIIAGNLIDGVPTGIRVFGSLPNSNIVRIEHNDIINCQSNGVLEYTMSYEGIDLGGGVAQSAGQNTFSNPGARDVELISSSGNMHALSNCWTTANPDDSIIDQLDSNTLGRVTSSPTYCAPVVVGCSLLPALITNVVGLADTVVVTVTTNGNPAVGASVAFTVIGGPNVGQGTNNTTDAGGQASFLYTGNGGVGSDTIQAIATAGSNSATGTAAKVWVGVPPQITCPGDIVTNTAPGACSRTVTYNASASGTPTPVITYSPLSGSSFSPGINGVTATASNDYGSMECSFTVTVDDNEPPTISCVGNVTTNIPFGQVQVNIAFGAPTASDNCGVATNYCSPAFGSAFALGTNAVTCTAVDASGNTNTCTFNVTVLSLPNQPPVAQCSNITVSADANCQATVSVLAVDAGSFDSDGTITSRSLTPGPFDKGTNNVTLTVLDNNGASNTCNAQIIIVDTTPPTIGACADIITNVAAGTTNAVINFSAPVASDNCGVAGVISIPASGSIFSLGTNPVVSTVTDTSGNTNSCSFNIIVRQTAPSPDDLNVLSVKSSKKIRLNNAKPSRIKPVKVAIQNIGLQTVTIDTIGELTNLVALTIESLGACPVPAPQIVLPKKGFPVALAPKKKLTVIYRVMFDCANDDAQGTGHKDFRYTVTVNHAALDGKADANSTNDDCPRPPNRATGDKGCGGKDPMTKQLGADILTDVVEK